VRGRPPFLPPADGKLPGFPDARTVKPKTPRQDGKRLRRRWKTGDGTILEWDYQHGSVEAYDRRGRHIGEFDPSTVSGESLPIRRAPWSLDMKISYRLAAFDRETEELIGSYAVPAKFLSKIKQIADIAANDDGAGDYPLDADRVFKIAKMLGIEVQPESIDYFIEPFLQADRDRETAARR
jgi:hypothetical protein